MPTGSFAEILREKIEKADKNTRLSPADESFSSINSYSKDSLEWTQLRQRLLEQNPNSFSALQSKMSETPYRHFQNKSGYGTNSNECGKKVHSKANSTSTPAPPPPRLKGIPHKLNDKQTSAMSYFINEKIFLLEDFTLEELKKAYRKLALVKHPDKNSGSEHAFIELKHSYECLSTVFKK